MSGNSTHGYDLAIEFSERFFNQFLGATLDAPGSSGSSLLCQALSGMGVGFLCGAFTVDVLMDRPTDVAIPAGERDIIDIRIAVGGGLVRLVVGLTVDRSLPDADIILIDFRNRLFAAQASFGSIAIPEPLVRSIVSSTFDRLALPSIPLPGGRSSTDPTQVIRADTAIIDDRSAADRDAWALLLTWGGGTPGNVNDFTESFVPPEGNGAIAIFFNWLCRMIGPLVADALHVPRDAFTNCTLNRSIVINADEDVTLTQLSMSLEGDFIRVDAGVRKSGFCYEATGSVTARLRLEISGGHLIVQSSVDDPSIDVSIPWYCWLAAIVVGAVIGGILFGVIGAIVGAVVIPLIMWISTEVIEGVIANVTGSISGALDALSLDQNIAIPGLEFILDRVFIDDITIGAQIRVIDHTPVRGSGTLYVPNGSSVDLDKGVVGDENMTGADLKWSGSGFGRKLETICISALARTGSSLFDTLSRYELYGYPYLSPNAVPVNELAVLDPFGLIFGGGLYSETKLTYAVRTNENRYAVVKVVEVEEGYIRIQYKTFENVVTSIDISGSFKCERIMTVPVDTFAEFTASAYLQDRMVPTALPALPSRDVHVMESSVRQPAVVEQLLLQKSTEAMVSRQSLRGVIAKEQFFDALRPEQRNIGHWSAEVVTPKQEVGRFVAVSSGLKAPVVYQWAINSDALDGTSGTITVSGKRMEYTVAGNRLTLKPLDRVRFQFELKVTAIDDRSEVLVKTRCITYEPACKTTIRHIPPFKTYLDTHMQIWGIVEEQPIVKGGIPGTVQTHG